MEINGIRGRKGMAKVFENSFYVFFFDEDSFFTINSLLQYIYNRKKRIYICILLHSNHFQPIYLLLIL